MSFTRLLSREAALQNAVDTFRETGILLTATSESGTLLPAARGDDPGLFVLISLIGNVLEMDARPAFELLAGALTLLAFTVMAAGVFAWTRTAPARATGLVTALVLAFVALRLGDVYLAPALLPMVAVPLLLALLSREPRGRDIAIMLGIGVLAGVFETIRSQASAPVLAFALVAIAFWPQLSSRRRASLFLPIIAGLLIVQGAMGLLIAQRDASLAELDPAYSPPPRTHVVWHSIYVGLGYVSNEEVPRVADATAKERVARIDPNIRYLSREYERELRTASIEFVRKNPRLTVEMLGAKSGVAAVYLLLFGIAGLLALLKHRAMSHLDAAFAAGAFVGVLPGILVFPEPAFMIGGLAMAALWGIHRVNEASIRRIPGIDEDTHVTEKQFHDSGAEYESIDQVPVMQTFEGPTSPEPAYALEVFGEIDGAHVLDLGSGSGEASVYLALQGARVTALDISPRQCELTETLARNWGVEDSVETICSPIESAPLDAASFDFVYGYGVLHHVDIEKTARIVARVLKPGGTAAFIEPLAYNPLINVYRILASGVRTPTEHPLKRRDLRTLERHFPQMRHREFQLFTLFIYIWMFFGERLNPSRTRYWKRILTHSERYGDWFARLSRLDRMALRAVPFLRWLCYTTVIVLVREQRRTEGT